MHGFRNICPASAARRREPLADQDWDMWLGPAPVVRRYNPNRGLYHFRWFWDYSGGQTTNLLAHDLDIVQWVTGHDADRSRPSAGGTRSQGFGETPDACEAIFEFPGFIFNWSNREVLAAARATGWNSAGPKGGSLIDRAGFEIVRRPPEIPADDQIPQFSRAAAGGLRRAASHRGHHARRATSRCATSSSPHVRDFLDCVKSREQPVSDLESGHRTATSCHLAKSPWSSGGRSAGTRRRDVVGDPEASTLLRRYRAPWDRELRAALPKG